MLRVSRLTKTHAATTDEAVTEADRAAESAVRRLLAEHGLQPADLLAPANDARFRPVYDPLLRRAAGFLCDAWDYTNLIPRGQVRVRLGCAWPVLIGWETLEALKSENVLDPSRRIKVSRKRLRSLIFRSIVAYPWPRYWNRLGPRPI